MDALVAAGATARAARLGAGTHEEPVRVVLVPTAVARHRPDLAVAHGRSAFEAAATWLGIRVRVDVAPVLDRNAADDPGNAALVEQADLVHLPGGDPDLVPSVLKDTLAWDALLRASGRGACVAGASAGAMALAERLWTRDGPAVGLGLVPGIVVLPHFELGRVAGWRAVVDPEQRLTWLGLEERTLVIGPPGGGWTVHGAGRAHVIPPGAAEPTASAADGEPLAAGVG